MRLRIAGLIGLLLCVANSAHAQYNQYGPYDPYNWSVYNEGPGIKLGEGGLVFHPGLSTELGYDSNVFLSNAPQGAGLLRLRLHLDLSTLPPQRIDASYKPTIEFRAGAMFEYRQFFSGNANIGNPQQLNGISNIDLAIKPYHPFSLRLYNNLIVTNDARNGERALAEGFAPRLYDRIGFLGTYRSGGGQGPLEVGLGDAVRFDYYIDEALSRNRSIVNEATLYGQLRVLPQTTIKLEVRSSYLTYYGTGAVLPTAVPLRIIAAANSLLIPAIGITLFAGYGNSLQLGSTPSLTMGGNTNYNNFVGGAELRLRLLAKLRLSVGWARDFFDSIFATYLADDRVYLHYDHYIWRGLVAHLHFDAYFRQYGQLVAPSVLGYAGYAVDGAQCLGATCNLTRSDVILNLAAELNYRVLSWMELGVSYSLLDDITSFRFVGPDEPAAFIKHTVLGKIDIAY